MRHDLLICRVAVLVVAAALAAGCGSFGGAAEKSGTSGPLRTYSGLYTTSFEVSSFVPCGTAALPGYGEGWWLETTSADFWQRYRTLVGPVASSPYWQPPASVPDPRIVYVRFEGTVTRGGSTGYGHLEQYGGQVYVQRVLEMRTGRCPGMQGGPPR